MLPIVPADCQKYFYVGNAEQFRSRLRRSVFVASDIGTAGAHSKLFEYKDKGFAIVGTIEKNEFKLMRITLESGESAPSMINGPMIHGQISEPDSGTDLVRISFEPNPNLNKVLVVAKNIADILFLVVFIAGFWKQDGFSHTGTVLATSTAMSLCILLRATITYMRKKFPADPALVEYVRQIAAQCKADEEGKLRIEQKND